MPLLLMQCERCHRVFSSGIELGVGSSAFFSNNKSQCPHCGSMENVPNGNLTGTIDGVIKILENSPDPLQTAQSLFDALEKNKNKNDLSKLKQTPQFSKFKKWIPDSPNKILIYLTVLKIVIEILTKNPSMTIDINNIVTIYNEAALTQTK
ncbi:MAG: hypothetical protein UX08_C0004G0013 [Candidatus Collierbacteria bacterium GW2011_GWB1_45_35]|uniref:Uncharacterized protein n=2 Tax=Candidatus Collieribacteriota TaxID=1752725 RepID=A0A0G1KQ68_9BACT|nr:MAG: hypothetical protein UW48_C0002G0087 [Microgenomates group bacterium GW2011_GWC1_44_23]KKT85615.1 MAG: hypothetical protein UW84_C0026G0003 [Candidatus Collierbacteria bacterium GW2011_GWA2_44_99]KKT95651.1 MAG: hypothetical protein UW96_C0006G0082 [Candidatus Collierbacteria bacterium GW2011_GWA1_45_15]KKU00449.1 MAG: hypothetical protein UX01_C0004G0016 [Candidatus Collierbacteria bacterium GW2011_GWB2_45_17]KKU05550.1 MAG: hypothetical protein UX08_C0004G0013 [Candidatus Collierbacte